MPSKDKRKLAAIMFADVVGYSRMMASNEERTLELLKDFENICSPIISKHEGEIIKKVGDELFCEFSSAKQAVDSALAIQDAIQPYNDSRPKDFKLQVRIGIHVGDIVLRDGDVFGDGVNVASRIQPFASPGGICVSNAVRDAISSHPNYDIQSEGQQELKNIIEKHTLYSIKTGFEDKTIIKKYKKSKKTIPVLLGIVAICIAGILFFGDSLNVWNINNQTEDSRHTVSLIHITSLPEYIPHITEYLTLESDNVLYPIDNELLDSLRTYFSVQLLNWYFGQDKEFIIPRGDKEVNYLNNHPLLSVDLAFTEDRREDVESWKKSADSIYTNFNKPDHISYLNIYKISSDIGEPQYIITESYLRGNPNRGNNGNDSPTVQSISKLFDTIKGSIDYLLGSTKNIGIVSEIHDDIIMVNVKDKNVRKDMELLGTSTYNFGPGNNGYSNRLEDLKNALDYMNETNEYDDILFQSYRKTYDSLLGDSLYCRSYNEEGVHVGGCVQSRGQNYYLRVVNVRDSIAVTKVIKYRYPWVQARINDSVSVTTN